MNICLCVYVCVILNFKAREKIINEKQSVRIFEYKKN